MLNANNLEEWGFIKGCICDYFTIDPSMTVSEEVCKTQMIYHLRRLMSACFASAIILGTALRVTSLFSEVDIALNENSSYALSVRPPCLRYFTFYPRSIVLDTRMTRAGFRYCLRWMYVSWVSQLCWGDYRAKNVFSRRGVVGMCDGIGLARGVGRQADQSVGTRGVISHPRATYLCKTTKARTR